jgi:hypothetical protein
MQRCFLICQIFSKRKYLGGNVGLCDASPSRWMFLQGFAEKPHAARLLRRRRLTCSQKSGMSRAQKKTFARCLKLQQQS